MGPGDHADAKAVELIIFPADYRVQLVVRNPLRTQDHHRRFRANHLRAGLSRDVRHVTQVIEVSVMDEDEVRFRDQRVDQRRVGDRDISPPLLGAVIIRMSPSTVLQTRRPGIGEHRDVAIRDLPANCPEISQLEWCGRTGIHTCLGLHGQRRDKRGEDDRGYDATKRKTSHGYSQGLGGFG